MVSPKSHAASARIGTNWWWWWCSGSADDVAPVAVAVAVALALALAVAVALALVVVVVVVVVVIDCCYDDDYHCSSSSSTTANTQQVFLREGIRYTGRRGLLSALASFRVFGLLGGSATTAVEARDFKG